MVQLKDIPSDVQWVWLIQWLKEPIGLDTLEECNTIIKANPSFFPWETKYNSIPQTVHDAYNEEKYAELNKAFETLTYPDGGEYIGLIPSVLKELEAKKPIELKPISIKDIHSWIKQLDDNQRKEREEKQERFRKAKALWDKYYSPYKLDYRE